MADIPSMWRTELWHPMFVHFPLAILSLAAVLSVVYLFVRNRNFAPYLRFSLSLLLWCGVVLFWVTFYTGQLAYSIVVRTICDPTVLKDHLFWAYVSGISFSIAAVLDGLFKFSSKFKNWFNYGSILLMVVGTFCIGYVGHLGGKVVYQQGGGVYQPSENCGEFD